MVGARIADTCKDQIKQLDLIGSTYSAGTCDGEPPEAVLLASLPFAGEELT